MYQLDVNNNVQNLIDVHHVFIAESKIFIQISFNCLDIKNFEIIKKKQNS